MRLPFLSTKDRRGDERASPAPEERLRSRAFAAAVEDLARMSRCRVLDLGAARGENVDFFSGVGCTLEILDLYPQLTERPDRLSRTHESFAIGELVGTILQQRPGQEETDRQQFDLLLAWDLFDFLSPEQIRGLVEGLEPWVRKGSLLLSRVSYLGTVPSQPRQVRILDAETLQVSAVPGRRSSPRYTEPQLLKVMPGWEVDQCFLQRAGFREYLFVRR